MANQALNNLFNLVGLAANIKGMKYSENAEERAKQAALLNKQNTEQLMQFRREDQAMQEEEAQRKRLAEFDRIVKFQSDLQAAQNANEEHEARMKLTMGPEAYETMNNKLVQTREDTKQELMATAEAQREAKQAEIAKQLVMPKAFVETLDAQTTSIMAEVPFDALPNPEQKDQLGQLMAKKRAILWEMASIQGAPPKEADQYANMGILKEQNFLAHGKFRPDITPFETIQLGLQKGRLNSTGLGELSRYMEQNHSMDGFEPKDEWLRDKEVEALELSMRDDKQVAQMRRAPRIGTQLVNNSVNRITAYRTGIPGFVEIKLPDSGKWFGNEKILKLSKDELNQAVKKGTISITDVVEQGADWALDKETILQQTQARDVGAISKAIRAGDTSAVSREDMDWLVSQIGEDAVRAMMKSK